MRSRKERAPELTNHPAYKAAVEQTDRAWIDAGAAPDALKRDSEIADLFDQWIASGRPAEEFAAPAPAHKVPVAAK